MASQHRISSSTERQLPSRTHLSRQNDPAGLRRAAPLAASCLLLAIGACAGDPEIDLATCGAPEVYRIDRVELPKNNTRARELGLDVDRGESATIDNQLGMLMATLGGVLRLDAGAAANDRLAAEVAWDLSLRACGDRTVVSVGRAESLDEVQLVGDAGPGMLSAHGAGGELPLSLMFDPDGAVADPGWLRSVATAIELERSADGARISARLGVALDDAAVLDAVVPPVARFFEAHGVREPDIMQHLDRDHDGRITEEELRASTIVHSLLAPDLRVGGAPALSLGLGLSGARKL